MQFHIPQYIDIEDKLFGSLTLKQAIYLAGGSGAGYMVWRLFPDYLFISAPIIAGIAVLTWALAFYPKEKLGKPFIEILEAGFQYAIKNKLYTWKKINKEPKIGEEEVFIPSSVPVVPTVPSGRLSSASFGLGVKGLDARDNKKTRI